MAIGRKKSILKNRGRNRATRPKSFKSEENAKKYGESLGKEFKVEQLGTSSRPKYRVRVL